MTEPLRSHCIPDFTLKACVLELHQYADKLDRVHDAWKQGSLFGRTPRLCATARRIHRAGQTVHEIARHVGELELQNIERPNA